MSEAGEPRLILVTGPPRSGTTAVGATLGLAPGAGMLHEPFNYHVGLRDIGHYFVVPGGEGDSPEWLDDTVAKIRALRLSYKPGLFPEDRGVRKILKRVAGGRALNSYRRCRATPGLDTLVWKDPFAVFCARHLATRHDMEILVTVRNPWAVAGSFKRLGWGFDLEDLIDRLESSGLLELPSGLRVDELRVPREDPVRNAAALWFLAYEHLRAWSRSTDRIRFLRLERLVQDPVPTYRSVFAELDLPWTERVAGRIRERYRSDSERTMPREGRAHDAARDLQSVNRYWKKVLEEEEANTVTRIAGDSWARLERDLE